MNPITLGFLNPCSASEFSMQPTLETKPEFFIWHCNAERWASHLVETLLHQTCSIPQAPTEYNCEFMTHFMADLMRQWTPDFMYGWTLFWISLFCFTNQFLYPWSYCFIVSLVPWVTKTHINLTVLTKKAWTNFCLWVFYSS